MMPAGVDYNKIRKNIVKKLYSTRKRKLFLYAENLVDFHHVKAFAKGHLLLERLKHGIPMHLAGFVKDVLKDLIKEGIILYYGKTKYGDAFQLNIKKLKEIEDIIFK